eukprot:6190769-Pleurochrysis_carterae.AAC.2
MECLGDFNVFGDSIYADGFEVWPINYDKADHDESMACGQTEESMLPFDSALSIQICFWIAHIPSKNN